MYIISKRRLRARLLYAMTLIAASLVLLGRALYEYIIHDNPAYVPLTVMGVIVSVYAQSEYRRYRRLRNDSHIIGDTEQIALSLQAKIIDLCNILLSDDDDICIMVDTELGVRHELSLCMSDTYAYELLIVVDKSFVSSHSNCTLYDRMIYSYSINTSYPYVELDIDNEWCDDNDQVVREMPLDPLSKKDARHDQIKGRFKIREDLAYANEHELHHAIAMLEESILHSPLSH